MSGGEEIMDESYSERTEIGGAARTSSDSLPSSETASHVSTRELIAQLLPGVNSERIALALLHEREPPADTALGITRYNSEAELGTRELRRLRAQFTLGEAARSLQHAFNNPLTALLAEAQLLELETLAEDQRAAVSRILDLARRLVALSRRLGVPESPTIG
jgi:nitrogen-specific signal transduction histidine kinase